MSILKTFDAAGEEIIRPGQMISKSDNFPRSSSPDSAVR